MFNSTNAGIGHTTRSIDNLSEQQRKSPAKTNTGRIHHLTPASRSQSSQSRAISMQIQLYDAAHQPSTSINPRYNSLLILKTRDYQNAPGSSISLTTGGLVGGTRDQAMAWHQNLSEEDKALFNQSKTDSSKLNEQEKLRVKELSRIYTQVYRASGKQYRGETSEEGDTSSSRPTTGQLRLTESDMKKYYG